MSNWALDLQNYDLVRIWIRGEANILADAPSRVPWGATLAKHLPIPGMPVRDLVKMMYQDPGGLELLVDQRLGTLGVEPEWSPLSVPTADGPGLASENELSPRSQMAGKRTPEFGTRTPEFGVESVFGAQELGDGDIWFPGGPVYPSFPLYVLAGPVSEAIRVGPEAERPVPVDPRLVPVVLARVTDDRGDNYVVRWNGNVEVSDGESRRSVWFNIRTLGQDEALRQAWQYFDSRYLAMAQAHGASGAPPVGASSGRFGPCGPPEPDGKLYHGTSPEHEFLVHGKYEEPRRIDNALRVVVWDPISDTFCGAEEFCGHCAYVGMTARGSRRYYCLGHDLAGSGAAAGGVAVVR